MRETCSCGPSAPTRTRQAVLDAEERWALLCPGCGWVEALPFEGGVLILAPRGPEHAREGGQRRVPA